MCQRDPLSSFLLHLPFLHIIHDNNLFAQRHFLPSNSRSPSRNANSLSISRKKKKKDSLPRPKISFPSISPTLVCPIDRSNWSNTSPKYRKVSKGRWRFVVSLWWNRNQGRIIWAITGDNDRSWMERRARSQFSAIYIVNRIIIRLSWRFIRLIGIRRGEEGVGGPERKNARAPMRASHEYSNVIIYTCCYTSPRNHRAARSGPLWERGEGGGERKKEVNRRVAQ